MVKFKCEIKGINNLEKKINKIITKLPKRVEESIEEVLKNIQGYSIRLENGHNSNGILVEMIENSTMKVKGKVYADPSKFITDNNESYLWFEYFGTGNFAEKEHIGKTKHFLESRLYRMVHTCKQSRKKFKLSNCHNKWVSILCSCRS